MRHLIIIVFILAGCSTKPTNLINKEKQDLVIIDITKKYPEKRIYVQDIADLEYIPLETNDSTLVSRGAPDLVSEKYIVYHNQDGQILVFSRQGKSLYSFNRRGGSNEEYNSISGIILDDEKEELFIEDIHKAKIFVYSIDGKFKRKLVLPSKFYPECLMVYNKDYLFCYNSYFMDKPKEMMNAEDIKKEIILIFIFINRQEK